MKYKSSPSKLLGVLTVSLVLVSQAWAQKASAQGAMSVDQATSSDPWGAAPADTETQSDRSSQPSAIHRAPTVVTESTAATSVPPGEEYGPPNYLKVWKNPFGSSSGAPKEQSDGDDDNLITLKPSQRMTPAQMLSRRLISSKLYLPERILIGESSKFTVKGPPNWRVAIAMADKDEGAKPVNNHKLRLGADRKVVAIGKIPPTGVLELYVATPIQGDLIGTYLFFEAALWSKDDLSDTQLAETVPPVISKNPHGNGVQIAALTEKKRGLRIVPDGSIPTQSYSQSLSTGQQP